MPHYPKPWFRQDRGLWEAQIGGKQITLGPDEAATFKGDHELMARPVEVPKPVSGDLAITLIDSFLE